MGFIHLLSSTTLSQHKDTQYILSNLHVYMLAALLHTQEITHRYGFALQYIEASRVGAVADGGHSSKE
jgi:hypothetical protein